MAGIYIHIPFCKKKCIYCDFYSLPDLSKINDYCEVLKMELKNRVAELGAESVHTVYFGGGTPSLLPLSKIEEIINCIKAETNRSDFDEVTIEVNPDDVSVALIESYKKLGINRISMGVQSFNDEELKFLRRRHDAKEALEAVEFIKKGGIDNISLDLIYGIPGQTIATWMNSLNTIVSLDVPHISCYNLSYEEGTPLYALRKAGKVMECSEDLCLEMGEVLISTLKGNGYEHYEISNFAKPGFYSKHNSSYWDFTPYLGIGVSAHSYDGTSRRYNPFNIKTYMDSIRVKGTAFEEEVLDIAQKYNEYVMLRLRTKRGLSKNYIYSNFPDVITKYFDSNISKFIGQNLLFICGDNIGLSEKGFTISDMIIRDLIYVK